MFRENKPDKLIERGSLFTRSKIFLIFEDFLTLLAKFNSLIADFFYSCVYTCREKDFAPDMMVHAKHANKDAKSQPVEGHVTHEYKNRKPHSRRVEVRFLAREAKGRLVFTEWPFNSFLSPLDLHVFVSKFHVEVVRSFRSKTICCQNLSFLGER